MASIENFCSIFKAVAEASGIEGRIFLQKAGVIYVLNDIETRVLPRFNEVPSVATAIQVIMRKVVDGGNSEPLMNTGSFIGGPIDGHHNTEFIKEEDFGSVASQPLTSQNLNI